MLNQEQLWDESGREGPNEQFWDKQRHALE